MILIEFEQNLFDKNNLIKYKNTGSDEWYYMFIDFDILNLLISNFGLVSTLKIPTRQNNCDNPSTGKVINIKYYGSDVKLLCNSQDYRKYITCLEENF
jgi:hypothetical protein